MSNSYFQFRKFRIDQEKSGMKVTTDASLFGAWVAREIKCNSSEPERILDIGSGTGLLSLMLSQVTTNSSIEAIESNEQAYHESGTNFESSVWRSRLKIRHQSFQTFESGEKYDLIICNPPFFKGSQKGKDETKNDALHTEDLSQKELLEKVQKLLTEDGTFYLLYPQREMRVFQLFAQSSKLYLQKQVNVRNEKDGSIFRNMAAYRFKNGAQNESDLTIRNSNGNYSNEFWELLKDYYLEYNAPEL